VLSYYIFPYSGLVRGNFTITCRKLHEAFVNEVAREVLMPCPVCASGKESEFSAEINIHHSGLGNVTRQPVLVFSRLVVCLDCGSSRFTTPRVQLELLAKGIQAKPDT
jgi:hypothetical protein